MNQMVTVYVLKENKAMHKSNAMRALELYPLFLKELCRTFGEGLRNLNVNYMLGSHHICVAFLGCDSGNAVTQDKVLRLYK